MPIPAELRNGASNGQVTLSLVVGADGRVVGESAVVLQTTHPEWARVVLAQYPSLRFLPAERGGCAVAARIVQTFPFSVRHSVQRMRPPTTR